MAYVWVSLPSYLPNVSRLASLGFQDTREAFASLRLPPGTDTLWLIYGSPYLAISLMWHTSLRSGDTRTRYGQSSGPGQTQRAAYTRLPLSLAWLPGFTLGCVFFFRKRHYLIKVLSFFFKKDTTRCVFFSR